MADQTTFPEPHGDEAELFRSFNDELMRTVAGSVFKSSPEIVEDACAFAWAKFMEHQPDRERNWRGWLFRTAHREAWLPEGQAREVTPIRTSDGDDWWRTHEPADPLDPHQIRLEVKEAFEVLAQLPPRLRRIELLRALGLRHHEIGELTGDSTTRVGQLIGRSSWRVYEVVAERSYDASAMAPPRTPPVGARAPSAGLAEREDRVHAELGPQAGRAIDAAP
jgi:DNA-directed RNA polymerase specialized sigma24 family protein